MLYIIKHKITGEINLIKLENDRFYFFGHDTTWTRPQLEEYYTIIKKTKLKKLL
jgi:hypothetical protein